MGLRHSKLPLFIPVLGCSTCWSSRSRATHHTMFSFCINIVATSEVLLPHHQNRCMSPELGNRFIYLSFYTQKLFPEGLGLDQGIHVSISSISDPQMSAAAAESTSFCAFIKCTVKCGSLFATYPFRLQKSCSSRTALRHLHCGRVLVLRMPLVTFDEF